MRIAICDDSMIDCEMIEHLLKHYFENKSVKAQLTVYSSGQELVYDVEEGREYEVVFLDIYMGELLGIDAARSLRQLGYRGKIIFLTASAEYAVESYDVQAEGYLLKPHSYDKLCTVMDRILAQLHENALPVRVRNQVVKLPLQEIMYIESNNNRCTLHSSDGSCYTIYRKLSELSDELSDGRFLRCHQSFLVNMNYIKEAKENFILQNGETVLIRRRSAAQIKKQYMDYLQSSRFPEKEKQGAEPGV